MIMLTNVDVSLGKEGRETTVFQNVNLALPCDRRIAILGAPGSGKSTFIRLLAGLEKPVSGTVERHARLSYPVGYARGLKPDLSPRQNVQYAARIYDADVEEVIAFVEDVVELGDAFDKPVSYLPHKSRAWLCFALSYAVPFDVYLIDGNLGPAGPEVRAKCLAMMEARAQTAGIVFATSHARMAQTHCDMGAVIVNRNLVLFDNVQDAVGLYVQTLEGKLEDKRPQSEDDIVDNPE